MIGTPRNIRRSSVSFRERQPLLTPRMRSIILYWLMKVVVVVVVVVVVLEFSVISKQH